MAGTNKKTFQLSLVLAVAMAMLIACNSGGGGDGSGSGGGGTDVEALTLPDRIELTNVEDNSSARSMMKGFNALYSDADTDYTNTEKHSWVDDTEALDMINDILGICKDTGYEDFVNLGPYKALVRQVGDSKESQSGSNTTNTTTEQLMEMYVDVTRSNNNAPMIVKIWVEEEDGPGEQAMLIRGHFTVSQGVSDSYPYGVMTAHFRGTTLTGDQDMFTMAMSVNAENGNVIIETVEDSEEHGDFEFHSKVQVVANADVTQGNAYVWESDTWVDWESNEPTTEETEELIAFNEDYFKVTEDGTDSFYSKDNLMHRIYNYKLFNAADGSNLEMNSGFPIETEDGKHGYIGYWGIWAPHGASIENGDTVTNMDGDEYTVFRARGKLTMHSQDNIELGELTGMELSKWDCDESECQDLIVTWDGSNFIKLGERNDSNGMIEYYESGDAEYHAIVDFEQWDGAWCEALRAYLRLGNLFFDENGDVDPDDESTVYFHSERTIDPETATDLDLYSWEFTLDLPITQSVVSGADQAQNDYWSSSPTEKTFNFVAAEMMLYQGANAVEVPDDLELEGSYLEWGYHIGPLTTTRYNANSAPYFWEAHEAETYYTWNTGDNDWNQFATLKDGNDEFISFDAPISFSYTHSTANDINGDSAYNGKVFRMEYDGNHVHIPWEFDSATEEWEPQINIKDGVLMGDNEQYVIKATDESLIMGEIADPTSTFPTNTVGEPDLEYDPTKTAQVGDIPTDAELKVIKGEVIE
jgi:hypothetical protein